MDAVERNGYELIPHPAYSPDLAPSDFFLFPNLKKDIRGLHFRSDEEAIASKKKRWISTGNKLGWLLIDSPSYYSHNDPMPISAQC